ncbi:MAG: hypothetical protein WC091_17470 [Sulfuricellaceae bacterium]
MDADKQDVRKPRISVFISIGKDLISLLRDGALFLLAVLLVVFPAKLNSMLIDAGFKEGSVAGFKWQSSLVNSNQALEEAQARISELQKVSNDQVKALAEARALLTDTELKQRITKLEKDNIAQKESTGFVQNAVAQTIKMNAPLIEKIQMPLNKSDYLVGLQTLGISDEERIAINAKLSSDGYGLDSITWSYPAGERPSWFAPRSTVFYYSASALPVAQGLARFMKAATKQNFVVQRGAGLGVDPNRRDVTFFVHFIKE